MYLNIRDCHERCSCKEGIECLVRKYFEFSLRATHDFTLIKSKERNLKRNLSNPFTNVYPVSFMFILVLNSNHEKHNYHISLFYFI